MIGPPKERRRSWQSDAGDQNRQGINRGEGYGTTTVLSTAAIPFLAIPEQMREIRLARGVRP